jgi:transposase
VRTLAAQGKSRREISRLLALARNTVRRILRTPAGEALGLQADAVPPCDEETLAKLKGGFERARGNVVRVQQLLADEGIDVAYSTLTRWVREAGLRAPPRRAGAYDFRPGAEMQHDTSPQRVTVGGKTLTVQCAGLVLAYSRRLFIQYYPRFTRFEAKAFLLEAVRFMGGSCPLCVIDNTSVIVAHGAGADAVIAPEMLAFARTLGFGFRPHRVGHPDRKGRIERPFSYVEGNFLSGRSFADYDDLNRQAVWWCAEVANAKPKRALGMSPEAAYRSKSRTCSRCRTCCRRFTSCSIASSTCTASSRSTRTGTRLPNASSARRSPSTSSRPKSMSASGRRRSRCIPG